MTRSAAMALKALGLGTRDFEVMSMDDDRALTVFCRRDELAKQTEMFPDLPGTEPMKQLRSSILAYSETPRGERKFVKPEMVCVFEGKVYVAHKGEVIVVTLPQ